MSTHTPRGNAAPADSPTPSAGKQVILIIVDALTARVLQEEIGGGHLPNLARLTDAGALNQACIAIFPSVTHAALASLATGAYPWEHGIPGGHWYEVESNEHVYLLGEPRAVWERGPVAFAKDLLLRYNHVYQHTKTIFEHVEETTRRAACINFLIHRGRTQHAVALPSVLTLAVPDLREMATIWGPSTLMLGTLVQHADGADTEISWPTGTPTNRFGFDDAQTGAALLALAEHDLLPGLTVAYFADNDYSSHANGPSEAVEVLQNLDTTLGTLFDTYGGLERFLARFALVITGDHAQTDIDGEQALAAIDVAQVLDGFPLVPAMQPWPPEARSSEARSSEECDAQVSDDGASDGDVIVCPNLRALQLYVRTPTPATLERLAHALLADPAVDQVVWHTADDDPGKRIRVATLDRGELRFRPHAPGDAAACTAVDQWGGTWSWDGELAAVDGRVDADGRLHFGAYPNAFERLWGALANPRSGNLWATARPGAEFSYHTASVHLNGGSHGSLHVSDSLTALIVAGAPPALAQHDRPWRSVDVLPLCLSLLGLPGPHAVGHTHMTRFAPASDA